MGLLGNWVSTPEAKRRLHIISVALLALVAVFTWLQVLESGPSRARVIAAIATSVGAVIQGLAPAVRRRRRGESAGRQEGVGE